LGFPIRLAKLQHEVKRQRYTLANALKQFAILDARLTVNLFPKWFNVVRKTGFLKALRCYTFSFFVPSWLAFLGLSLTGFGICDRHQTI
jgi:hypothetical protein